MADKNILNELMNEEVVLDTASSFVIAGKLVAEDANFLVLTEADVHDLRDTTTTRELYVLETRRHGISPNRSKVYVRRDQVVSISLMRDVME